MTFRKEYTTQTVYPDKQNIYQAFDLTPFEDIKVVILGQDPYHGPNQAHGLAFSVQPHAKFPPSLRNMYQELENDIGCHRTSPHLQDWAREGVLLLNTVLTVRQGEHIHIEILDGKHSRMKSYKLFLIIVSMLFLFCGEDRLNKRNDSLIHLNT